MTQCQAITEKGNRCSREAYINVDLTKKRNLLRIPYIKLKITTPTYKCCFFCKQHAAIKLSYYSLYGINKFLESRLSWEEWILYYPKEAEKFFKDYNSVSLTMVRSKILDYIRTLKK